jgi:Icc-related predicted phosphoesterase
LTVRCHFASDLHGRTDRYEKLWRAVADETPDAVLLGGDLLPHGALDQVSHDVARQDFVHDFLAAGFERLRRRLGPRYPRVLVILGNDDARFEEAALLDIAATGLWTYAHERVLPLGRFFVLGYAYVPPTPFLLKDWERYDVSRHVPPGCVSPEEGRRSVPVPEHEVKYATIEGDLTRLAGPRSLDTTVLLCHTPPYETSLDRAANDGKVIDHVPLDLHVGSIALRRFIERRQPLLALHGHIHESARLTGSWRDRIGRTHLLGGAHDGAELALVRVDLADPARATRELL